ncbi:radiation-inducible immediate-early gene IEX-1 [Spea bombifrons]|uniref:radiation-inducible immediate-early gene IEX-1 n=1 Tax=Spea bombifrons TaxID=233779 RepID=UPI00234A6B72|nr:radiation-inducible immediate-early gene IEX-1 [Spea bombifrons]
MCQESRFTLAPQRALRSCQPEVFTFDVERKPVAPRRIPASSRSRRPRRVLYPAQSRRYLPVPSPDWALRCLYLLCLVLLVQIFCEEAVEDGIPASQGPVLPTSQSLLLIDAPGPLQLPPLLNMTCAPLQITLRWLYQQR